MNNIDTNKFVKVIQTTKYKNINLYLRFSIENQPLLKEKISLLAKLIGDKTNKYPTKLEMTQARDMLYGISLDCQCKGRANILTLSMHFSFLNPKFVDATVEEYNSFIKEVLYNTIIDEDALEEAKHNEISSTLREIDKPFNKEKQRFIDIVSKDNKDFSIYANNKKYVSNIEKLKLADILAAYKEVINKTQLNVYLCGDLTKDEIFKLTAFNFNNRKEISYSYKKIKGSEKKTIIDKDDISQTCLSVVYKTPFNKKHKDFFSWFMANAMLGGAPTSLLFSEVREKMSLCYTIGTQDYKAEGLVRIVTAIDGKNKDKVIKAIEQQVKRLISKDYDPNTLEITKVLMANSISSINDDIDELIDFYYESFISGFNYTIEEYCQNIMKVTQKDISNVVKKYEHYFNHVLVGSKHE